MLRSSRLPSARPPFQPTLPARGATTVVATVLPSTLFQPTLPARGATGQNRHDCQRHRISTHAPRTGSDLTYQPETRWQIDFNPRSPHGERPISCGSEKISLTFQPTLPARGATHYDGSCKGGRLQISTHAPRTGSDRPACSQTARHTAFQPTLPARGATAARVDLFPPERFQPTLPARGATGGRLQKRSGKRISTHAPRTGSDDVLAQLLTYQPISTHAPRTGSDLLLQWRFRWRRISTHAPRTGSDSAK